MYREEQDNCLDGNMGRQSSCTPLSCSFWCTFLYHLSNLLVRPKATALKAPPVKMSTNRGSPHTSPDYYSRHSSRQHDPQAGITMCCTPTPWGLTVRPSSCSFLPDKYHPGQSIKHISPFLKPWMFLSFQLPYSYVMQCLSGHQETPNPPSCLSMRHPDSRWTSAWNHKPHVWWKRFGLFASFNLQTCRLKKSSCFLFVWIISTSVHHHPVFCTSAHLAGKESVRKCGFFWIKVRFFKPNLHENVSLTVQQISTHNNLQMSQ